MFGRIKRILLTGLVGGIFMSMTCGFGLPTKTLAGDSVLGQVAFTETIIFDQVSEEHSDLAIAKVEYYVNVRSGPDTDSEIIGKMYNGAIAHILGTAGENGEWLRVLSGNVKGYIKAEYFIIGTDAQSVLDDHVVTYAEVTAQKLNVREKATTDSSKIGYLNLGEQVEILENLGEWLRIQYTDEKEGYISAKYIKTVEEFTYALSVAEEQELWNLSKEREERGKTTTEQNVEESQVTSEPSLVVTAPAINYTSNEELRKAIIEYAYQYLGNKYINGGRSLETGTDCSGFTCYIYAAFGYSISRTTEGQYTSNGRSVSLEELQPGDIVCFSSNGGKSCTHVALYIGGGQIIHSANSRKGVIISGLDFEPILGYKNIID